MVRSGTSRPIELSTTRISRLLRPLRTKCIALATVHPTPSATTSTYGSKSCPADSHPLDVLPPPDTVRSYHVEHRSVASLRVALYAVRDCFREIVVKTKPADPVALGTVRIPRLTDLCSTIVGESMEGDVDSGSLDAEEDSEQLSEVEELYEAIPVQYRRSALLAHSLDIILRFPHHFTLLSILLDVTLQHEISHESCVILHWLLRATLSPVSDANSMARLCHTAHSNYLIDLGRKWVEASLPMSGFVRILTMNLIDAPPHTRSEIWICHALTRFTRKLGTRDFESLLDMASSIARSLPTMEPLESSQRKHRTRGTKESSLTEQLNKWLTYSSPFPPSQTSILEFLDQCYRSGVHRCPSKTLAATVVCWATHYLAIAMPIANTHSFLHRLLKDVSPTVTMYNLLVEKIFGIKQPTTVELQESRALLKGYADCLRANNLLLLEASLWVCALRFAETDLDGLGNEVSLYREELIVAVDDAERRCFQASQSGWEWEESLGCWIQCDLPPAKKAKHHHAIERSSRRHRCPVAKSLSASCPLADIKNKVFAGENRHDYDSAIEPSLVSHPLSNRTKLYAQRRSTHRTLLCASTEIYTSDETTPTSDDALNLFVYTDSTHRTLLPPPTKIYTSDDTAPTSDDALNLFAYTEKY